MPTRRVVTRVETTTYLWVRWRVDGGHSGWHQVREDAVPYVVEGEVQHLLRLWTRCGYEVPDPQELEIWPGSFTPVGQTCIYCTRSLLVEMLPPLGTPPVPGRGGRARITITWPRRKGSAQAPSTPVDHADAR